MARYQLVHTNNSRENVTLLFDRTQPLKVWEQIGARLNEVFDDGVIFNPAPKGAEQRCQLFLVDFYKTGEGFNDFVTKMKSTLTTCGHQEFRQ